jgi:hypothetical protein
LLKIDGEKREDSSLASASPHLASDFSRIPGYTGRNQARAAPNELQVMRAHDMEGPAAEKNIDQLADNGGGPALGPFPPAPLLYPPSPAAPLGPIAATGLNVTVATDIRAASTPTGLPNRIPPRVDTPVSVGITGWSIPMLDVTISVDSNGVDYNYDITTYSFVAPGRYTIHWQMGGLHSNTLELEIVAS